MALSTQTAPYVLVGNIADLPNPASVPQGYIFYASDTGASAVLSINPATGARIWSVLTVVTTIGGIGLDVTYIGGTLVPPTKKIASFTATKTEATSYEIDVIGLTVTLDSGDPVGQRYEFNALGTLANPNTTFTPNGGKTITGPGGVSQASQTINVQGYWRSIEKQTDGNWLLSGL